VSSIPARARAAALLGIGLIGASGCANVPYTNLRSIAPIHGNSAAGEKKAAVCVSCHGADGNSAAPTFPRLAGQRSDYLYHRLVSFRHADPKSPYYSASPMTAMAAQLSDVDMRDLATYFANQTPSATDRASADKTARSGEALYLHGDPAAGIPPCQGCHGADAEGTTTRSGQYATYPALRGQYPLYVAARLNSFRNGQPADTSNAFIMHGVAATLDDSAIAAIAEWLGSLGG
jgi:cytochrome c553